MSRKVIVACTNKDCIKRGGAAVHARLKENLAQLPSEIEYDTYKCFGACEYGPNVILYPQLELYSDLTPDDVPAILARITGGPVPSRLVADLDEESLADVEEAKEFIKEDYE